MEITNWLHHTTDPDLQRAAHEKIQEVIAFEKNVPGVIIIHNIAGSRVAYMSERGRKILNVTLEEIRLPQEEYHQLYFNPEDVPNYVPKILAMLDRNDDDEIVTYFQQVRPTNNDPWTWYSTGCKVVLRDKEGKPLLALATAIPIDPRHHVTPKIERLAEENNFLRKHHHRYHALTKREKELLKLFALGLSPKEIGNKLHLSEATVVTHKRNLRKKLDAQSPVDLLKYAQAFDLV